MKLSRASRLHPLVKFLPLLSMLLICTTPTTPQSETPGLGLQVTGIDISSVGLEKAQQAAAPPRRLGTVPISSSQNSPAGESSSTRTASSRANGQVGGAAPGRSQVSGYSSTTPE